MLWGVEGEGELAAIALVSRHPPTAVQYTYRALRHTSPIAAPTRTPHSLPDPGTPALIICSVSQIIHASM